MKQLMTFLILVLTMGSIAQNTKITHNLVIEEGKYLIKYNEQYFDVDTTTVTVKIKDSKLLDRQLYKIIRSNKLGYVDLSVPSGNSITEFVNFLFTKDIIEKIEYSTFGEYIDFIPNDTYRTLQWHLPVINMYKAWDICTGSSDVIIGVLDSGTDWEHPDIGLGNNSYQNIYFNTGEDAWADPDDPTTGNGIDDDNNGFIDDWKGWNYADNSNDTRTTNYHGTFVAGIACAKTNNNFGIAGVAGGNNNSGAKVLPYCVGVSSPISSVIDDAIIDAVDNGVMVIQLSLTVLQSTAINDAIQYAIDNNVVVVCASGNGSSSTVSYPASNSNVISVGAIGQDSLRANFSNYGNGLDVVAPGVDIYSTTLNNGYGTHSGTSFAAPQVSAIAALVLSVEPNLTTSQIRQIIESTAQKAGGYIYQITPGRPNGTWNEQMSYGLVDAYAAVQAADCPTTIVSGTISSDITYSDCIIEVVNATIQNNADVVFDAEEYTLISGTFEVQAGSTLEVK
jgi:subtilisin family serine protease